MNKQRNKPDCPYCGGTMQPLVMGCPKCEVEIRGRFRLTQFSSLPSEDLEFLERYLLAGFSIKALAEESGLGYVAIRNRLDRIIETYRKLHGIEDAKRVILEQLEKGEISSAEAVKKLEGIQ